MSEFSSTVELNVEINDRSLANARDEIEDELGSVESAVAADTGAGGAGGAGRQRRRRRLEFRWARENNENLAAILDVIDNAEFGGGGDGLLGGIGAELLGAGAETAGDVAIETADEVTDVVRDVITGTVSTALGNAVADAVNSNRLGVRKPEWVPLRVEDFDGGPGTTTVDLSTTLEPTFEPTFNPEFSPEFSLPDLNIGGGGAGSDVGLETPHPVEFEEPVRVEVVGVPARRRAPMDDQPRGVVERGPQRTQRTGPQQGPFQAIGSAFDDAGAFVSERLLGRDAPRSVSEPLSEGGTPLGRPAESFGRFADRVNPFVNRQQQRQRTGTGQTTEVTQGDINVTVQADADSIVRDVRQELEREFGRRLDQLERQLSNVEDQLDRAQGSGPGSGLGGSVR